MRVTFLLGRPDTTGGDRVLGRYARGLAERGHDVTLLAISRPRSLEFYRGLSVRSLDRPPFPRGRIDYLTAVPPLVRALPDPGIVVATWTPTLPLAATLANLGRARGVAWIQQDYPLMFDGLPWEEWLLANGLRFADRVVAVSESCARWVAPSPDPRVIVIHSGIEPVFFGPPPPGAGRPATPPRWPHDPTATIDRSGDEGGILFVGDPIERKGWSTFVEAVGLLRAQRPGLPVTIVSRTGPAGSDLGDATWLADLSDAALARLYRSSSVYLCASREEGWGLPALEAMASGCPVVTTRTHGCASYAQDGVNCLVVAPGDAHALASATERILGDPPLVTTLIRHGRATAARYGWGAAIDRLEEVLIPLDR